MANDMILTWDGEAETWEDVDESCKDLILKTKRHLTGRAAKAARDMSRAELQVNHSLDRFLDHLQKGSEINDGDAELICAVRVEVREAASSPEHRHLSPL